MITKNVNSICSYYSGPELKEQGIIYICVYDTDQYRNGSYAGRYKVVYTDGIESWRDHDDGGWLKNILNFKEELKQ